MKEPTYCPKCGGKTIPSIGKSTISYTCVACGHQFQKKKKEIIMESKIIGKKGRTLTVDDKETIVKLYKNMLNGGMKKTKAQSIIAKDHHHSVGTVYKVLKENDLIGTKVKKEKPEPEKDEETIKDQTNIRSKEEWKKTIKNMKVNEFIELKQALKEIEIEF